MEKIKNGGFFLIFSVFIILFVFSFFMSEYLYLITTEILIMMIFSMAFNLLLGYSGLLSFGQAAFFGIGGYTVAILLKTGIFSEIYLLLISSMIMGAIFSYFVGFFSVKKDEVFFAMITLGFGMLFFVLAHNWVSFTGGSDGLPIFNSPKMTLGKIQITFISIKSIFFLVIIVAFLITLFLYGIVNSSFGLIMKAIRENKERVPFVGGNVQFIRLYVFVISGTISALSGGLFAIYSRMASPDFLHWSFSSKPLVMTILGGMDVFWGPAIGTFIYFLVEQLVRKYTENWLFFLGWILLIIVMFFPKGILGTITELILRKKNGRSIAN